MILFLDDEKRRMDSYVEELKLSGHDVVFKSNISDALDFFEAHQSEITLLILDIMMPAGDGETFSDASTEYGLMTGIAFYKKTAEHNSSIPTIIFTNVSKESLPEEVIEKSTVIVCKKDRYLPFELEEKVKEVLARA